MSKDPVERALQCLLVTIVLWGAARLGVLVHAIWWLRAQQIQ